MIEEHNDERPERGPTVAGQVTVLEERVFGRTACRYFRVPDADLILEEMSPEEWAKDERMPSWAEVWPSGLLLAKLLAASESLRGVRMLELGCGLGLPSLVAALLGAQVTATDYIPEALALLTVNAQLNGVRIRTMELDWQQPGAIGRYDLVVAGDVMYERWQPRVIVEMLARTVLPDGYALIVDPERATSKDFANDAVYRGFSVTRRAGSVPEFPRPLSVYEMAWNKNAPAPLGERGR